jgi:hypothetical protein
MRPSTIQYKDSRSNLETFSNHGQRTIYSLAGDSSLTHLPSKTHPLSATKMCFEDPFHEIYDNSSLSYRQVTAVR